MVNEWLSAAESPRNEQMDPWRSWLNLRAVQSVRGECLLGQNLMPLIRFFATFDGQSPFICNAAPCGRNGALVSNGPYRGFSR
jgi:hypothetical protein